jgi:hypothetical protein
MNDNASEAELKKTVESFTDHPEAVETPASPEEQLQYVTEQIATDEAQIDSLTTSIPETLGQINVVRGELEMPATEEKPPSVLATENRITKLQSEKDGLAQQKETLQNDQEVSDFDEDGLYTPDALKRELGQITDEKIVAENKITREFTKNEYVRLSGLEVEGSDQQKEFISKAQKQTDALKIISDRETELSKSKNATPFVSKGNQGYSADVKAKDVPTEYPRSDRAQEIPLPEKEILSQESEPQYTFTTLKPEEPKNTEVYSTKLDSFQNAGENSVPEVENQIPAKNNDLVQAEIGQVSVKEELNSDQVIEEIPQPNNEATLNTTSETIIPKEEVPISTEAVKPNWNGDWDKGERPDGYKPTSDRYRTLKAQGFSMTKAMDRGDDGVAAAKYNEVLTKAKSGEELSGDESELLVNENRAIHEAMDAFKKDLKPHQENESNGFDIKPYKGDKYDLYVKDSDAEDLLEEDNSANKEKTYNDELNNDLSIKGKTITTEAMPQEEKPKTFQELQQEDSGIHVRIKQLQFKIRDKLKSEGVPEKDIREKLKVGVMDEPSEYDTPEMSEGKKRIKEIKDQQSKLMEKDTKQDEELKKSRLEKVSGDQVRDRRAEVQSDQNNIIDVHILKRGVEDFSGNFKPLLFALQDRQELRLNEIIPDNDIGAMSAGLRDFSEIDFTKPESFDNAQKSLSLIMRGIEGIGSKPARGALSESQDNLGNLAYSLKKVQEGADTLRSSFRKLDTPESKKLVAIAGQLQDVAAQKINYINRRRDAIDRYKS